jgi:PAS domain S-box-containing protein
MNGHGPEGTLPAGPPAAVPGVDLDTVFRSLFGAYPDALLVVDPAGTIVLANPAAAELLGYGPAELAGLPVDALVPDAIRPRHAAYRDAYGHKPRPRPMGTAMDLVAKRRDGSEVMVEIALSPLQNQGLPYVVAAIRGIGAYPRVRQALQRARYSEQLARVGRAAVDSRDLVHLLGQVPQAMVDALQVEAAALCLLQPGRPGGRVLAAGLAGDGLSACLGVGHPAGLDAQGLGARAIATGHAVTVDDLHAEPPGAWTALALAEGHRSALAVPLFDRGAASGALVAVASQRQRFGADEARFLESLSSLVSTSLQRAHSEEQLLHAQRLESVGQLTGGIAHDFNNLLTVIQGNLQVLEDLPAVSGDPVAPQLLGAAMRASRRGADLTGKLLAFSRRQRLQPTQVRVAPLLESLADMLRRTLDQRILIDVQVDAGCPDVLADAGQLESALLNIAINARDAMPDGGRLSFSGGWCAGPPPGIDGPADAEQGCVALRVVDNGSGMTEAVRERVFEPFFTTKEAGRGTGLGLSSVYGFVKQSRGAVALDSAPGRGTRVALYLPAVAAPEREPGPADDGPPRALPLGLRVLLVEDDAEVRAVVQAFLRQLGAEVTACVSGEQALAALAGERAPDLLLSDIALGAGMRGTELAVRAVQQRPGLPVLLMSGFSHELPEGDGEATLGHRLLPKPFDREALAQAIAATLAAR